MWDSGSGDRFSGETFYFPFQGEARQKQTSSAVLWVDAAFLDYLFTKGVVCEGPSLVTVSILPALLALSLLGHTRLSRRA